MDFSATRKHEIAKSTRSMVMLAGCDSQTACGCWRCRHRVDSASPAECGVSGCHNGFLRSLNDSIKGYLRRKNDKDRDSFFTEKNAMKDSRRNNAQYYTEYTLTYLLASMHLADNGSLVVAQAKCDVAEILLKEAWAASTEWKRRDGQQYDWRAASM